MSNDLTALLQQLSRDERDRNSAWYPTLFQLSSRDACDALARLVDRGDVSFVHDTIQDQLFELLSNREPKRDFTTQELDERVSAHLAGTPLIEYGNWVHYPWSRCLVHVLAEAEFREVRTNRNRYKIAPAEQARFGECVIGIVGLSVGQAAAVTMALEGVGRNFRLADADKLGLSNTNRLRAGLPNLGLNKSVLAARQMFEIDPYLRITVFTEGVVDENMEQFVLQPDRLDLLIEECDDLYVKVRLRELAREQRIPVLMETSDRGMLDIERFDREPHRPIFHGRLGMVDAATLRGLSKEKMLPYVMRIMDESRTSIVGLASLLEINESIKTWPQLASAVALGGAVATDTARRILLGSFTESGRYYIDIEAIARDGNGLASQPELESQDSVACERAAPLLPLHLSVTSQRDSITQDEIRYVVSHGVMAPSGGNIQPWRFVFKDNRLLVETDPTRVSMLDFRQRFSHLAIGAAVENITLASRAIGFEPKIHPRHNVAGLSYEVSFERISQAFVPPLLEFVPLRATNRRPAARVVLKHDTIDRLLGVTEAGNGQLHLLIDDADLARIGDLIAEGDRVRILSESLHREMIAEMRWTREEVERTRDGLDIATLELSTAEQAILQLIRSSDVMAQLRRWELGKGLGRLSKKLVDASSAVALLTVPDTGLDTFFHGGRLFQRIWLTCTGCGLALQPMASLTSLFGRLVDGNGEGFSTHERSWLSELRSRFVPLFPNPHGHAEVMLFRLAHADPPTARSLRRSVDDVLSFE